MNIILGFLRFLNDLILDIEDDRADYGPDATSSERNEGSDMYGYDQVPRYGLVCSEFQH